MPSQPQSIDLFCLPFAGGSSLLFHQWQKMAPKGLCIRPISLPGRDRHFHLAPINKMAEMLSWIDKQIATLNSGNFAIFGHSMGGVIGYAYALKQRTANKVEPRHLFVSASAPPSNHRSTCLHKKSAEEMRDHLRRYDLKGYLFDDHPELWEVFEPILRADFKLVETYVPPLGADKISCPITALSGTTDSIVAAKDMADWCKKTEGDFDLVAIEGGHLFLRDNPAAILDCVLNRLLISR